MEGRVGLAENKNPYPPPDLFLLRGVTVKKLVLQDTRGSKS
jgi:hypothetical protein